MVTSVGAPAAAGRGVTVSSPGQRTGSSSPLEGGLHHSPGVPKALAIPRPALVASRRGAEDEAPVGSLGAAGCGDDTLVAFGGRTPVLGSSLGRTGGPSASRRPSLDARAQVVGFGATPTADVFGACPDRHGACPDRHSPAPPRGAARCGVPTAAGLLTRQLSDADALLRTPLATLLASADQCQHDEVSARVQRVAPRPRRDLACAQRFKEGVPPRAPNADTPCVPASPAPGGRGGQRGGVCGEGAVRGRGGGAVQGESGPRPPRVVEGPGTARRRALSLATPTGSPRRLVEHRVAGPKAVARPCGGGGERACKVRYTPC